MTNAIKEVELVPREQAQSPAPSGGSELVLMFERFLADPNASVEKIERLMALWERNEAKKAENAFNVAMAAAQKEMHAVAPDAFNPQTKSRYATYAALDAALRPVYTKHGFALSFNTGDAPQADMVRVLCDVTLGSHTKPYKIDMPADGKGAKGGDVMTKTHAAGSGVSYGMRYLLKMIFNVAVGEYDDDGNRAGARQDMKAPEGFEAWWDDMQAVADEGISALHAAWNKSRPEFKSYTQKVYNGAWVALKKRAQRGQA